MTHSPGGGGGGGGQPLVVSLNCLDDPSLEQELLAGVAGVEHVSLSAVTSGRIEVAAAVLLPSLTFLSRAAQRRLRPWQLLLCLGSPDRAAAAADLGLRLVHVDANWAEEVADTVMVLFLGLLRRTHLLSRHVSSAPASSSRCAAECGVAMASCSASSVGPPPRAASPLATELGSSPPYQLHFPQGAKLLPSPSSPTSSSPELEDLEEDEELQIETPRPKGPAKVRRKGKLVPEDESDADFNDEEEEELEEDEELEIQTPRPKRPARVHGRGRKGKPAGSSRWRHEDDDDYEEEIEEEDEDFDPEVDEEEVEEDDEDLGDYAPVRAKKNHVAKGKPAGGRQHRKRRRRMSGSSLSKGKARKGMSARRRGMRWVADDYEDEEEEDEDEDFVVQDDLEEVNYRPRKKATLGRGFIWCLTSVACEPLP